MPRCAMTPRYQLERGPAWEPVDHSVSLTILRRIGAPASLRSRTPYRIIDRQTATLVLEWNALGELVVEDRPTKMQTWVRCEVCQEPKPEQGMCMACEMDRIAKLMGVPVPPAGRREVSPKRTVRIYDPDFGWREADVMWDGT